MRQSAPGCRTISTLFLVVALIHPFRASAQPAPPEWRQITGGGVFSNHIARSLRYVPDHGDFVIENGEEFFNRPLYCRNTAFRVDGGDKPEFSLYVPGRGGNLRFGLRSATGEKWLNDAQSIVTRYRPGSLLYEIRDPLLGGGVLRLTALPLNRADGLIASVALSGASEPVDLICAFGGANAMRGRRGGDIGCETEPIRRFFQLRPDQCRSNEFVLETNGFMLHSRTVDVAGIFSAGTSQFIADAGKWNSLTGLLASSNADAVLPVVVTQTSLRPADVLFLALQRVETNEDGSVPLYHGNELTNVFSAAEQHRREVAERVIVETPDPFIDAAQAAINVASDAIWDEPQGAYMHGAVAWRNKLLGWRGPYTADALGWHVRALRHLLNWAGQQNTAPIPTNGIPPADASANLARNEASLHSNGDLSRSHYDMNLVYIDALFRHVLWTGDLALARQEWPMIERHLAWERRLFRRPFGPEQLPLYEAYNCIWASDNMQFNGGGATHSTAYNYFHNRMAARIARFIGQDAGPYEREADLIQRAMRQYLWLGDRGWFAEWKDYLGLQLAHPNAGLWTFYHTIDSEVPTPFEAWQMTRFVDTQIARIPVGNSQSPIADSQSPIADSHPAIRDQQSAIGDQQSAIGYRLSAIDSERNRVSSTLAKENLFILPSTSWMPYMWSLNNVVMAEVAHTSLGYWQANRPDEAFALFKGCLLGSMFLGTCPGNVGMTSAFDMARGEAQRDFGDGIGICSRTMIEGLFGVHPDALAGELLIRPGFPADWNHAKLRHPDFHFEFRRDGLEETYRVESTSVRPMRVRLQVTALRTGVASVLINGQPGKWRALADEVGLPRIEIEAGASATTEIVVTWKGAAPANVRAPAIAASGSEFRAQFGPAKVREVNDPEGALRDLKYSRDELRGTAAGTIGHRTVFAQVEQGDLKWWQPVTLEIRPPFEIVGGGIQDTNQLRFRLRNNTAEPCRREVVIHSGKVSTRVRLDIPAFGDSSELTLPADGLRPGSQRVAIDLEKGRTFEGLVTNWKLQAAPAPADCEAIDLVPMFNDRVTQIFRNDYVSPRSPFCSLAMPKQGIGGWSDFNTRFDVDDSGLRAVARTNGGRLVVQGVPFKISSETNANNILFTSQWDNYPHDATVGLNGRASHLYLLMAGSSNPMESRFDNGEIVVSYTDGSTDRLPLNNPLNWWPIDQDYFIDDFAFRRPEPIPPRVDLRTGRVRLIEPEQFEGKGARIPGGAATVLELPLNPGKELKSLTVRALANEVVIGVMAVTLAR